MERVKLNLPSPLELSGDVAGNWTKFSQRLEFYLQATGKDASSDKTKTAILLTVAGSEAIDLYNTWTFREDEHVTTTNEENETVIADDIKYDAVIKRFKDHCDPQRNETYQRYVFRSRVQGEGEPIEKFITDVKNLAKKCSFSTLIDGLIRDQIVIGIRDQKLKERLLNESDLTRSKAEEMCRNAEMAQKQLRVFSSNLAASKCATAVDAVRFDNNKNGGGRANDNNRPIDCNKCGRNHPINKCSAFGKTCWRCGGKNHISKYCGPQFEREKANVPGPSRGRGTSNKFNNSWSRSRGNYNNSYQNNRDSSRYQHEVMVQHEAEVVEEDDDDFYVNQVDTEQIPSRIRRENDKLEWLVSVKLNNNLIEFKVDSGAQVNCISEQVFNTMKPRPKFLDQRPPTLRAYNKEVIPCIGSFFGKVALGDRDHDVFFVVTRDHTQPILGLATCLRLGFFDIPSNDRHVLKVHGVKTMTENDGSTLATEMTQKHPKVFEGLGRFQEPYKIKLRQDYKAVVQPVRRVPLPYKEKIEKELVRMEELGVISKVSEPTEFVNSFVVVKKKGTDEVRLCLDPRDLNKSIMREHYPTKTREEILADLGNPKYFTELDLRHAYWQIPLDEESRLLTTFGTNKGRFCFNVGPFGLNSMSDACQRRVEQHITDGIEGALPYQDNIIIVGSTQKEHDDRVRKVFQKIEKAKITLNLAKCKFGERSIMFLGEKISEKGVEPDSEKVKAIQKWPKPHDVKSLQSFFGILNFVGRFVPNLSSRTTSLRTLLRKGSVWVWDQNHDKEFEDMKGVLVSYPVLRFYDPAKEHKISNDASKDGIGSVLLQLEEDGFHPVHYAARSLTKTERSYAPIEREALAIQYGCSKFHHYVFGKRFFVETDHNPLVTIFGGYLNEAPARIQCIMLKVQKYNFELQWVPRKFIMLADALSKQNAGAVQDKSVLSDEIDMYVNEIREQVPVSDDMWLTFQRETAKDPELLELKKGIESGKYKQGQFDNSLRSRFHIIDGVIFMSNRIYVPKTLRDDMINRVHEGHLKIEKSKRRARSCLYWPGMSSEVEDAVRKCQTCNNYIDKQPREPLVQDIQDHPWHKIGTDIFSIGGKDYLVVVDYMSNFPEVATLPSKEAKSVIRAMKPIFARHGIPAEVTSDNVPFKSFEFQEFAKEYGFRHDPISPKDSNANGKAEMGVKIVKTLLKKAYDSGTDPSIAMLNYRSTPLECGKSPAELLMGRKIRTRLPMLLRETPDMETKSKIDKIRHRQKVNYDKGTRELPQLEGGDSVRILQDKGPSVLARVVDSPSPRSYRVQTENDRILRRNRNFLVKTPEPFHVIKDYDDLKFTVPGTTNNYIHNNNGNKHNIANNDVGDRSNQGNNMNMSNSIDLHHSASSTLNIPVNNEGATPSTIIIPESNVSNEPGLRRSQRIKSKPVWHKDYEMAVVKGKYKR